MKVMFNCVPRGVSNRRGAVCAHRARGDSRSLVEKRSWQRYLDPGLTGSRSHVE